MMNRRTILSLLAVPALCVGFSVPAAADTIPLSEISRYFNSFTTAQGDFTQINPDGSMNTGRIYIHRPGRVRFEYDPPEESLVLAGGGQVAVFDARSNQGPTTYPLRRTPLNLILAERVDLARDQMVVRHYSDDNTTSVVAQDPEYAQYGSIKLVLTANPTELRQWVIVDDMGRETTVILGDLVTGTQLRAGLFSVQQEARQRGTSAP